MCRWLAYLGKPKFIEQLLFDPPHSLVNQSYHSSKAKLGVHGDGVGISWYGIANEPGLYRDSAPAWNDQNFRELCHQTKSSLFFAHVRASTGAPSLFVNCHPFRYDNWIFMHNGQIGNYNLIRREYENSLSDLIFAHRQGTTDSEMMFLKAIDYGFPNSENKYSDSEDLSKNSMRKLFMDIQVRCKKKNIKKPIRATICLSDGKKIWVIRWSSDSRSPTLFLNKESDSITIVSEPLDSVVGRWKIIPENSILSISLDSNFIPIIKVDKFL